MAKLKLEKLRPMIAPAIQSNDLQQYREQYKNGDFERADKVKDLDKRYRWDLFRASVSLADRSEFFSEVRGMGANDNHVDSLLKSIVPPIK